MVVMTIEFITRVVARKAIVSIAAAVDVVVVIMAVAIIIVMVVLRLP
jgi:hypothetical protein